MFYHLFYPLSTEYSIFNVFRYITFRSAYAGITALAFCLLAGPPIIRLMQKLQIRERIRKDGPEQHQAKSGTPTMGGLLILAAFMLATLLWSNLKNDYIWVMFFVAGGYGLLGFIDDWAKLKRGDGLKARTKMVFQILLAFVVALFLTYMDPNRVAFSTILYVPFFKEFTPDIGELPYLVLIVLVIVGTSNAVNLTDGLDGLAIGPIIIAMVTYTGIVYLCGHFKFAGYLNIQFIKDAGEVAVLTSSIVGASLGFLWFNAYPAQLFMGDVGSLSLGAMLGTLAVITKQELLLLLVGGIFVIEALSVIIQVTYFRSTGGKRFFKMAPLHHHFEKSGWAEPKVIVRFWIVAVVLAMISLSTLKLR